MDDLQIMLRRFRWAMLLARVLEAAGRGAAVGGIVAAVVMVLRVLDWRGLFALDSVSSWTIPVVLLSAGGLCGAFVAFLRGASELQTARLLDRRYDLKEHLSTASELLAADDASSEAVFVYAQATQSARALPRKLNLWRCTRRTPAMLLLTILLCGAMLLLPGRNARLAERLVTADAQQRDAIRTNLRRAAGQADPETQSLLSELTRTIEVQNEAELRRILEKLRQAGVDVHEIIVEDAGAVSPVSAAGTKRSGKGEADKTTPHSPSDTSGRQPSLSGSVTAVYHPRYASVVSQSPPESSPRGGIPISADDEPIRVAWQAAQARAAEADLDVPVPGRYRFVLQAFSRR